MTSSDEIIIRRRHPRSISFPTGKDCDSPIVNRRKSVKASVVDGESAEILQPVEVSGAALKKIRRRKRASGIDGERAEILQPVEASGAALKKTRLRKAARRFQVQAKEDRKGMSVAGSENSSDDVDQPDLSNVSSGSDHSNAARHVYLASLCSQGNFPTPLHKKRYSGRMAVAGASFNVPIPH